MRRQAAGPLQTRLSRPDSPAALFCYPKSAPYSESRLAPPDLRTARNLILTLARKLPQEVAAGKRQTYFSLLLPYNYDAGRKLLKGGNMAKLTLWLTAAHSLALEKTCFSHPIVGGELKAVRGKTAGAYHGYSTFQWTPAVQSMALLVLRTAALGRENRLSEALIEGGQGSPASSLDYSIGKAPAWMLDIFGVDRSGSPLAKRLFRRTNPERKRNGPVAVAINESMLPSPAITIFIDHREIQDSKTLLEAAEEIERCFSSQKNSGCSGGKRATGSIKTFAPRKGALAGEAPAFNAGSVGNESLLCPCCGVALAVSFLSAKAA